MKTNSAKTNTLAEIWAELHLVLNGRGSIVDALLPALIFLVLNALVDFNIAVWGSLVTAVGFALFRLFKRHSLLYVILGLAGAGLTALLAQLVGLKGYILPGLITGGLTILMCLVSLLAQRPMVAWTSHFVRRWPRAWYWHPQVRPAYSEVTLAWAIYFSLRLVLDIALAQIQNGLLLSIAKFLGGWPATILLLIASYLYGIWRLRKLHGPSIEEFQAQLPPPWKSQSRGF